MTSIHLLSSVLAPSNRKRISQRVRSQQGPAEQARGSDPEPTRESRRGIRIEYSSPDEGWIGAPLGGSTAADVAAFDADMAWAAVLLDEDNSHYRFMGVSPWSSSEDVKAAYRRLSKTFHPDSTELPLDQARESFLRLTEAYQVLSNQERRKAYDWQIVQNSSKKPGSRFVWPYELSKMSNLQTTSANGQQGDSNSSNSSNSSSTSSTTSSSSRNKESTNGGPFGAQSSNGVGLSTSTSTSSSGSGRTSSDGQGSGSERRPKRRTVFEKKQKGRQVELVPLADSASAALVFDAFALVVAILVIIYVGFFKGK